MTDYFLKFVHNYAQIAIPLTNLFKKDVKFEIKEKELNAMQQLKEALSETPILRNFCRDAETELHTDTSKFGFSAKLEGKLYPVNFWSKKSSQNESYILEVKAAYLPFKKFRHYVLGK